MNITNSLQFRNSKTLSHHICHDGTILLPTFVEFSRWHRIVNYRKNFTLDDCSNLSLCVFCCCHVARSVYERHCACEQCSLMSWTVGFAIAPDMHTLQSFGVLNLLSSMVGYKIQNHPASFRRICGHCPSV